MQEPILTSRRYTQTLTEATWPSPNTVVLDVDGDDASVWMVNTGPANCVGDSRFANSWNVHRPMLKNLPAWDGDHALLTTARGFAALPSELRDHEFVVNPDDLTRTLTARIALLDAALQSALAKRKQTRIPTRIAWPHIDTLGAPEITPTDGEHPRSIAFHNALWLARFCAIWDSVEHERESIPFLRGIHFA